MKMSRSERFLLDYLASEYKVVLQKIPESFLKSPDYELVQDGVRQFVAELKTLEYCEPTPERGWTVHADELGIRHATRQDNSVARVARNIHDAYKQLRTYPQPKVLILLNEDGFPDVRDLEEVYRGEMVYGNSDFSYVNTTSRKIAQGMIKHEKCRIDLYIWVDRKQTVKTFFRSVTTAGRDLACRFFHAPDLPDQEVQNNTPEGFANPKTGWQNLQRERSAAEDDDG
jgi:hypothetical protein